MKQYNIDSEIIIAEDAVVKQADYLIKLGDKALIITSKNAAIVSGALGDVISALGNNGQAFKIFDKIKENPLTSSAREAGLLAKSEEVDFIIAIGGGSVIDAAKAAAVFAANDVSLSDDELFSLNWKNDAMPMCFVGTTAGTGSEVTSISVLTDDETLQKRSICREDLFAKVVFCDYHYTKTMNFETTLSTALDAFCHAIEGYFSDNCDTKTDVYSHESIMILFKQLTRLSKNANIYTSGTFRNMVYKASVLAGVTLNTCKTCFPHLAGYILTEQYGVPHGFACAYFINDYLELCQTAKPERCKKLLDSTGVDVDEAKSLVTSLNEQYFKEHQVNFELDKLKQQENRFATSNNLKNSPGNLDAKGLIDLMMAKNKE